MEPIKCVVVGDARVGKTCLSGSYTKRCIPEKSVQTIFDSVSTNLMVGNNRVVTLNIWDTAAKEEVNRLRPIAYAMTDIFLIVFAIDNPESLENVRKKWAPELQHHGGNSLTLLVGNKSDLRDSKEDHERLWKDGKGMVSRERAIAVANEIGACDYCECSALTTEGLKSVFDEAIQQVLRHKDEKRRRSGRTPKRCSII
mmetsp:Transcript_22291/g.31166  ORF Transcript_22291/g.31166 Transcript_22291/m.31166 type:complete len:199 (+) Transcript_22291:128-724(+)